MRSPVLYRAAQGIASWKMLERFMWDGVGARCFPIFQASHLLLKYARVTNMFKQ